MLEAGRLRQLRPGLQRSSEGDQWRSELMLQVFGDNGKHARFAVGALSLPLGCAVEVRQFRNSLTVLRRTAKTLIL